MKKKLFVIAVLLITLFAVGFSFACGGNTQSTDRNQDQNQESEPDKQKTLVGIKTEVPATVYVGEIPNITVTAVYSDGSEETLTTDDYDSDLSEFVCDYPGIAKAEITVGSINKTVTCNVVRDTSKPLRILALGNGFSDDCMAYFYEIATELGFESVDVYNLFKSDCDLATHASNFKNNSTQYTLKHRDKNTTGWVSAVNYNAARALNNNNYEWDVITVQQECGKSGIVDTYTDGNLDYIIDYVVERYPNVPIVWNMTWAYQSDSENTGFAEYNYNQDTMYSEIVSAVETGILTRDDIRAVIPVGTAIQNLRTSYIGDTLTRDGYNLNDKEGRLAASMMWVKALTGVDVSASEYKPEGVDDNSLTVIKECVANAVTTPYEITESKYKAQI